MDTEITGTMFKTLEDLPLMLGIDDLRVLFGSDGKPRGKRQTYELVHSEGFPAMKCGAHIKVPKWKLIDWVNAQTERGLQEWQE